MMSKKETMELTAISSWNSKWPQKTGLVLKMNLNEITKEDGATLKSSNLKDPILWIYIYKNMHVGN